MLALIVGGFVFFNASSAEAGEIFLEPTDSLANDPFSNAPLVDQPDAALAQPANANASTVSGTVSASSSPGGTAGLYGGSLNTQMCDAGKLVDYLSRNPSKAKAWVSAFNADPDLRWDRGKLTTSDIGLYVSALTPVIIIDDTRGTNHGYVNGKPTKFQSVLQKGSAILVDKYGVPRVRCFCGNPLLAPQAVSGAPKYRGKVWPGFDPSKIKVVTSQATPLNSFQVRIPARPNSPITTVMAGVPCAPSQTSGATNVPGCIPWNKWVNARQGGASTPPTTAPPTTTAPPVAQGQISIAPGGQDAQGREKFFGRLFGYPPNSSVKVTCGDSTRGDAYSFNVQVDGSGSSSQTSKYYATDTPNGVFCRDMNGKKATL